MLGLNIKVYEYEEGYTIEVNGEVILECLSDEEASELTLGEITEAQLRAGLL